MTKSIPARSFLHSLGVVLYVTLVATIMHNGNAWFGKEDTMLTTITVLLLACISAATVGSLVFGYPVIMFLNGQKKEGVTMAMMTIGWLIVELFAVLLVMFALR
jgi:hypothetical protein